MFEPGDYIEYCLVFTCKVKIKSVAATFRNQETGKDILLTGEAQLSDRATVLGTRVQEARLSVDRNMHETMDSGWYRLAWLEAITYGGHSLDFDNPPEDRSFYFREGPTDDLPKLVRGVLDPPDWFVLPED